MNTRMRIKAIGVLSAAAVAPTILNRSAFAHSDHATPGAALTAIDYPKIDVNFTADGIEGMPESVEAGRYLLTVTGEFGPEDFALAPLFLKLPDSMTMDDLMEQASGVTDAPPPVFYEAEIAGGKGIMAGTGDTDAVSVIDLTEGEWIVAGAALSRPPVPFTVTAASGEAAADPEHTVVLEMTEMLFHMAEGEFCACENVIKLVNTGAQPHFAEIMSAPEGTTNQTVANTIEAEMTGTPLADILDFSQTMPVAYLSEQSAGVTSWTTLTLEPGTYVLMCWIPDPETGIPHAMSGMHDVFVVSA